MRMYVRRVMQPPMSECSLIIVISTRFRIVTSRRSQERVYTFAEDRIGTLRATFRILYKANNNMFLIHLEEDYVRRN